ncbi:TetR/AcrR family transcriptional regulator [Microbacterium sp. NIBRBAC000506063]|uniref:TetR/AcrR family transcriptional regulator n=1 Tax=Microbacterium sp. NIBRBAC000506063 TaxID=2734618 RepID=UPI001BB67350|nr:TetR/AcrR family transcriptional regulator [Microbacterium sp. NIBRBAC000506063]QTV79316.1 helix-turn-helix transcriptional regulator [Microbacterium sp. NIBRBAC000506063]
MARATAAEAAETARRILEVARAHFAEHGYAAASVDEIARAADVTRGAVYHHYSAKPGLFRAVAAAQQEAIADAIVTATAGADADAALRAGSHAFLDAITEGAAARILLIEAPAVLSWDEWRRMDAQGSAAHLREGLSETGIAPRLLDAATAALSGAMNELALWLSDRPGDTAARAHAHDVLDGLLEATTSGTR